MSSSGRWLFALAGALDSITGALLLASPATTLWMMGVNTGPREPALLRFVGAFVFAVGLSYLGALCWPRAGRVRGVAEVTTLSRLAVGLYVAAAVASGTLPTAWATVAATDLGFAGAQIWLISRGALEEV